MAVWILRAGSTLTREVAFGPLPGVQILPNLRVQASVPFALAHAADSFALPSEVASRSQAKNPGADREVVGRHSNSSRQKGLRGPCEPS